MMLIFGNQSVTLYYLEQPDLVVFCNVQVVECEEAEASVVVN